LSSGLTHDFFGGANTVGIHHPHPPGIQCAFKAAAHGRLEQPVVQGVSALLTPLHGRAIAAQDAGDLEGKLLVPQFPTKPRRKFGGDLRGSAAVFAIYRNDFDHGTALPNSFANPQP
jgi:hypothetical protein